MLAGGIRCRSSQTGFHGEFVFLASSKLQLRQQGRMPKAQLSQRKPPGVSVTPLRCSASLESRIHGGSSFRSKPGQVLSNASPTKQHRCRFPLDSSPNVPEVKIELRRSSRSLRSCTEGRNASVNGPQQRRKSVGPGEYSITVRRSQRLSSSKCAYQSIKEEEVGADPGRHARVSRCKSTQNESPADACTIWGKVSRNWKKAEDGGHHMADFQENAGSSVLKDRKSAAKPPIRRLPLSDRMENGNLEYKLNRKERDEKADARVGEHRGRTQMKSSETPKKRATRKTVEKGCSRAHRKYLVGSENTAKKIRKSEGLCSQIRVNDPSVFTKNMNLLDLEEKNLQMLDGLKGERGTSKKTTRRCARRHVHEGWTEDQEAALRMAYFSAKPTPNFWKKVSKMVPGKSAQECFDRIHSDLPTPQQPQPRARNKGTNSPLTHFSISSSDLLTSFTCSTRGGKSTRQKTCFSRKAVRHILDEQLLADQGHEADHFSVLQDAINSPGHIFSPIRVLPIPDYSPATTELLQTGSRLSVGRDLVSPPVLKKVKNMVLHEKYIDQLHNREAKRRRGASVQARNFFSFEDASKENRDPRSEIKAAKNALVSDAVNFIQAFKQLQEVCICEDTEVEDEDVDEI